MLREQYDANLRAARRTVSALLPTLEARLARVFDTEGVVRKLRAGGGHSRRERSDGGDDRNENEGDDDGHQQQQQQESGAAAGGRGSSEEQLTAAEKAQLWRELTALTLSRLVAAAFALCLLNLLATLQISLLGRYVGLATTLEHEHEREHPEQTLPSELALLAAMLELPGGRPSRAVQTAYMRAARTLTDPAFLEAHLARRIRGAVLDELAHGSVDLRTQLTPRDLTHLLTRVTRRVQRTSGDGNEEQREEEQEQQEQNNDWMITLVFALLEQAAAASAAATSLATGSHAQQRGARADERRQLAALLDETRDLVDSADFVEAAARSLDSILSLIASECAAQAATPSDAADGRSPGSDTGAETEAAKAERAANAQQHALPLAKWLPKCSTTAQRVLSATEFVAAAHAGTAVDHFAALVFLSGEKEW